MLSGPELGKALSVAMELKHVNQQDVADFFGVKQPSVSEWVKKGRIAKRHIDNLLAYFSDVVGPEHWGLGGFSNVTPAPPGTKRIPLVSYVQAGMWSEAVDPYSAGDASDWLTTDMDVSSGAFALEIKGKSMLPQFEEGDRVIIDPSISPSPGDFVVAKNGEDEATFKKYRPRGIDASGSEIFELVPLNDDFPTIRSDTSPTRIVGTMVEHRKYRRK